ncbi:VanW family protein [Psychrobacillus sp. NEAU-3TGS]|uniref:VanW family protein n=1 Tax=Psychrobacillus sp. NEAU-3TGS TaxID=2995412 RepID=UPI002498C959|nr:VanW family protein [Psychrobacillus sp. NEAU-3TGS]MDI2588255.1 VanW family protein [Psychrobacillus sp. NEAU-3TGS]
MKILTKIITLICLITLFIYLLLPENNIAFLSVDAKSGGSTIGGIEIENLNKKEITSRLEIAIEDWKRDSKLALEGEGINLTLDTNYFVFDVEASVNQYLNASQKPWYAFWKSDSIVHIPLQLTIDSELLELIEKKSLLNKEKTIENIKEQVGKLSKGPVEAILVDLTALESDRIAFSLEDVSVNAIGLSEIIATLNEQVISTGDVFSFSEKIKELGVVYNDETADFVASLLYSVILKTNFEIVERHSQGTVPNYLEPGIEADIDLNANKDLKFLNKGNPAVLKVSSKDSSLLVELYSLPVETVGKYEVRESELVKPRTIYRYSSDLKAGEESLIQEGIPGLRVTVYRIISDKKGPFEKEEIISQDYYSPTHRIVLKSSLTPETNPVVDPDLEIDLNADGLPDMENGNSESNTSDNNNPGNNSSDNNSADEESGKSYSEDDLDSLPKGSYYDKAGNIITPK